MELTKEDRELMEYMDFVERERESERKRFRDEMDAFMDYCEQDEY